MAAGAVTQSQEYREGQRDSDIKTLFNIIEKLEAKIDTLQTTVNELVRYRATVAGIAFAVSTGAAFLWQGVLAWSKQGRGGP